MPNPFLNLCYNIAGKREIKKQRGDGQYDLLSGDTYGHSESLVSPTQDNRSDSSQESPIRKIGIINKLFKAKAKNSDDEATISSVYDQSKGNETDSSLEFVNVSKVESMGVVNRKKKRAYRQHKKRPGLAKIRPAAEKPKENKKKEDQTETFNISSIESDHKPVVTLTENNENVFQKFERMWIGDAEIEGNLASFSTTETLKDSVKPPSNKVNIENALVGEKLAVIKISELKVATMESIQESELSVDEEAIQGVPKAVTAKELLAKAKVSYEGLEGVFARPVVKDQFHAIKEDVFPIAAIRKTVNPDVSELASTSYSEVLPVFDQPRKNPWNVFPGLFEDSLGFQANEACHNRLVDGSTTDLTSFENMVEGPNPINQLGFLFCQATDEEERRKNKIISDFFAEEARSLNENDIEKYSDSIEISKIEIYEEDIKRYHQTLKYHRGPVDHDIMFTTVETALNFIEKLVKDRERKKKVGFFPNLLEKCLKSKVTRDKEEEEKKKKENRNKDPLKPKMWLVFNRLSKEKVIICTPGEFYDSD